MAILVFISPVVGFSKKYLVPHFRRRRLQSAESRRGSDGCLPWGDWREETRPEPRQARESLVLGNQTVT